MAYTYDPSKAGENGMDAMRFQLGDTMVEGEGATAFLADEEITATLAAHPSSWKRAKYHLIEAVCNRLSFETDWSDDGTAFKLDQRAERWRKMLEAAKKDLETTVPIPGSIMESMRGRDQGHYFYGGMQQSPYTDKGDKKL